MKRIWLLCLLCGVVIACDDTSFEVDETSRDILIEMLDIAQEHALYSADINWENTTDLSTVNMIVVASNQP
ncbi:MAG: hypothetical protein R8G66_14170 [Cytophagales bacterium]|nr:hypothetical protein [Cytophagales bacterium]